MIIILGEKADIDLQTILDMQAEISGGGFPNAPMNPESARKARERLESEFGSEEISQGLALMTDKRMERPLREF